MDYSFLLGGTQLDAIASPTAIRWFLFLVVAPVPLVVALQVFGRLERREAILVTYNLVAAVPNGYNAIVACTAYFDGTANAIGGLLHDRLYGASESSFAVLSASASYELWNTIAAIVIPEYRESFTIGHHFTTFYLVCLGT
jgi:hypothetical protein